MGTVLWSAIGAILLAACGGPAEPEPEWPYCDTGLLADEDQARDRQVIALVRARASAELGCTPEDVRVTGAFERHRAEGCGAWIDFDCDPWSEPVTCTRSERPTPDWTDTEVDALAMRLRDDLDACARPGDPTLRVGADLTVDGRVRPHPFPELAPAEVEACVRARLERETMGRTTERARPIVLTIGR